MNFTQVVVENDCIWGQSDYSRSHMNYSFLVKKWLYCQGQNKEMTLAQGCKWLYSRFRIRKWPQNVSQGGFKAGLISKAVKTYFERKAVKTRFKPVKTGFIGPPPPVWIVHIWNAAVYSKVKFRPISSYSELVLSRRNLKALNPLMHFDTKWDTINQRSYCHWCMCSPGICKKAMLGQKKINSLSQLPLAKKLCAVLFFFFFLQK